MIGQSVDPNSEAAKTLPWMVRGYHNGGNKTKKQKTDSDPSSPEQYSPPYAQQTSESDLQVPQPRAIRPMQPQPQQLPSVLPSPPPTPAPPGRYLLPFGIPTPPGFVPLIKDGNYYPPSPSSSYAQPSPLSQPQSPQLPPVSHISRPMGYPFMPAAAMQQQIQLREQQIKQQQQQMMEQQERLQRSQEASLAPLLPSFFSANSGGLRLPPPAASAPHPASLLL